METYKNCSRILGLYSYRGQWKHRKTVTEYQLPTSSKLFAEVSMRARPRKVPVARVHPEIPEVSWFYRSYVGAIYGLYRGNGRENGNYYLGFRGWRYIVCRPHDY